MHKEEQIDIIKWFKKPCYSVSFSYSYSYSSHERDHKPRPKIINKMELLDYLINKEKYNTLLMLGDLGFIILHRMRKYEILFEDKTALEFLLDYDSRCLITFDSGKNFVLNNEKYHDKLLTFQGNYKLCIFKEGIKFLLDNHKYNVFLSSPKWRNYLLSTGKYSILAKNSEGRNLLIENRKWEYVLSVQEGRDQFLKSIPNISKISQKTYMLLCISCIKYGDVKSFEILKNSKLIHPSKHILTLLEKHDIADKLDIYNLFYPFLNDDTQMKLNFHNYKKFEELLPRYKTCDKVIVFYNLGEFICEFF